MFGNTHLDRIRQMFADQFQPDRDVFVYRRYLKGAPIRVSEQERDAFIGTFNRRIRVSTWSLVPLTVLLIFLLAWLIPDTNSSAANLWMWFGLAVVLMPFLAGYYWAWNAPMRALARRPVIGHALTKEEARKLAFSRMTYAQLGLAALASVGVVWKASAETDILHGWGRSWLVVSAVLIFAAGIQAIRKWRFERG